MLKAVSAPVLVLWLLLAGSLASPAGQFYRWVDKHGVVHFTDNLHNIPADRRAGAMRIPAKEQPRTNNPVKTPSPTKASIPFQKHGQVVVIEAKLNNKAAARLVVDTGASYTIISHAMAKELNVVPAGDASAMTFQTANGIIQAPLVTLHSIEVGGIEIKDLTAAVHDAVPDPAVTGLLGLNFLSNFRLDIDTHNRVLHLERR